MGATAQSFYGKDSSLFLSPYLESSIPDPDKPHNGAAYRNDRHGIPRQGRGSGARGLGHSRGLLPGHIRSRDGLRDRLADHHCQEERGGELPGDRKHILPRGVFPSGPGCRDHSPVRTVLPVDPAPDGLISGNRGCGHGIRALEAGRVHIRVRHGDVLSARRRPRH